MAAERVHRLSAGYNFSKTGNPQIQSTNTVYSTVYHRESLKLSDFILLFHKICQHIKQLILNSESAGQALFNPVI
jgi:hypothetical protein